MLRSHLPLLLLIALGLVTTACEKKKTLAQQNAEIEKVWRVKQKGRAAQYYQTLVEKYPDSEYAAQAQQRLQALGPIAAKPGDKKPAATPRPAAKATPAKATPKKK